VVEVCLERLVIVLCQLKVFHNWLRDQPLEAISLLLTGGLWAQGLRVVFYYERPVGGLLVAA